MDDGTKKLQQHSSISIFLFLYGIIIQAVAFPIIYFADSIYSDATSLTETLIVIWYFIPVVAVAGILISAVQLKNAKPNQENARRPKIGLILNLVWLAAYLVLICLVFVFKLPILLFN